MATFDERSVPSCSAAAEAGIIEAQYCLSMHYATGRHVKPNPLLAHKWLNLTAMGGYDEARGMRADVALELSEDEISQAQRMAREWLSGQLAMVDTLSSV